MKKFQIEENKQTQRDNYTATYEYKNIRKS